MPAGALFDYPATAAFRPPSAGSVPQRSFAGQPGGLRFGDSVSGWNDHAPPILRNASLI